MEEKEKKDKGVRDVKEKQAQSMEERIKLGNDRGERKGMEGCGETELILIH